MENMGRKGLTRGWERWDHFSMYKLRDHSITLKLKLKRVGGMGWGGGPHFEP